MTIDTVFFVDTKGRLLLGRNYTDRTADLNTLATIFADSRARNAPIFEIDHRHYIYTAHNSVTGIIY